jgi:peroxiredoxin
VTDEPKSVAAPLTLAALMLALVAAFAIVPRFFHARQPALVGKDAPDFTLPVVANGASESPRVSLSDFRGRAVVLDFWATWCGPCRVEAPIVNKVAARYKDRGLVTVGVNTSDEENLAAPWAQRNGISFPIVFDEKNQAARAFGVENLPTLVVISRSGKILAMRTGVTDDAELEALVRQAL